VPLPDEIPRADSRRVASRVTYDVAGRQETLLYLTEPGELAAYEELRAGFTAAVSHELRTPLARLLALLETATLPGFDAQELVAQAQSEVEQIRELIDDVLFLSELETGREIVALGYFFRCSDVSPSSRRAAGGHQLGSGDPDVSAASPRMPR
jgi:signal transduction histidine kinase